MAGGIVSLSFLLRATQKQNFLALLFAFIGS